MKSKVLVGVGFLALVGLALFFRMKSNDSIKQIAVLIPGSVEFFAVQKKGLDQAAKEHRLKLIYADAEWDAAKQLSQVENFITRKVDLLLVCSVDNLALKAIVPKAKTAGIPLMTFSNTIGDDPHGHYDGVIAHIGRDEIKGGELLGKMAEKILGNRSGKILFVQGSPGTSAQRMREKGFMNVVKKHSNWKIVANHQITGWTKEGALNVVEDVLRSKNQVNLVVAQWWSAAISAAQAIKESKHKIPVAGLEFSKELVPYMVRGEVVLSSYFSIIEEGYKAVDTAANYLMGKEFQKFVEIEPVIVSKDNVKQFTPEL